VLISLIAQSFFRLEAPPGAYLSFLSQSGFFFATTRHGLNLFVVLVGESSKARKGTSWNEVARLFAEVDPASTENRVTSARLTTHGLMAVMGHQAGDRRLLSSPRNSPPCFTPWAAAAPRYLPCCAALGMAQPCACSTVTASSMPARTSQLVGHITLRELALRAI